MTSEENTTVMQGAKEELVGEQKGEAAEVKMPMGRGLIGRRRCGRHEHGPWGEQRGGLPRDAAEIRNRAWTAQWKPKEHQKEFEDSKVGDFWNIFGGYSLPNPTMYTTLYSFRTEDVAAAAWPYSERGPTPRRRILPTPAWPSSTNRQHFI